LPKAIEYKRNIFNFYIESKIKTVWKNEQIQLLFPVAVEDKIFNKVKDEVMNPSITGCKELMWELKENPESCLKNVNEFEKFALQYFYRNFRDTCEIVFLPYYLVDNLHVRKIIDCFQYLFIKRLLTGTILIGSNLNYLFQTLQGKAVSSKKPVESYQR